MNDLYKMPSKCQNCPYWEWAEFPYYCDCLERYENNIIPNIKKSMKMNEQNTEIKYKEEYEDE